MRGGTFLEWGVGWFGVCEDCNAERMCIGIVSLGGVEKVVVEWKSGVKFCRN